MTGLTKTMAEKRVANAEAAVARFSEDADPGDYSAELMQEWRMTPYGEALRALEQRRAELAELSS